MSTQNRQFFRKKLKLTVQTNPKIFITSLSNRNSKKQKLSPHKWVKNKTIQSVPVKVANYTWKKYNIVNQYLYNSLGELDNTLLVNILGVKLRTSGILGTNFRTIFTLKKLGFFSIITFFKFFPISAPVPLTNIATNRKVFFSQKTTTGLLSYENQLMIPSHAIHISQGSFYTGINSLPTKTKTCTNVVVRGIAKNPVDHPNGGRANTKGSFKTPWGGIAKCSK